MASEKEKIALVDGSALIFRAFFAVSEMVDPKGRPVNATYGFFSMLFNMIENLQPTSVVIAFDKPGPTFRHEMSEDYKAHRPEVPEDLKVQWPFIKGILEAFGMHYLEEAGFEADDILGTLSRQAADSDNFENVYVVTSDMDCLQLVRGPVEVVTPHKAFRESLYFDRDAVFEKLGVYPEQVIDYKGLRGDTADNIPGVKGIGEKGASKLLQEYGTLEGVYDHLDELKPAMRTKLENGEKEAFDSRRLATIITDMDMKGDFGAYKLQHLDLDRGTSAFEEYAFRNLITRLKKISTYCEAPDDQMDLFAGL